MAETIVMIHGMWGTGWYWENFKGFFEGKGYQCVVPTLRYHDMDPKGIPDPRLGTTSLLDYAADLEKLIRELEGTPILMGHSMGGLLAQILSSRGLAKALVFAEAAYSMLNLMPFESQKSIYDKFVFESGRAASEIGFWLFDSKKAARVDESKVTCPVLIVAGEKDRIVPVSVTRKIAEKYKKVSTYKEFPDHSHWVVGEPGWQEITEYIKEWLNRALSKPD
ncbi:MAG: alpha/beta hydrolase [Thermodesulfobacteriota bacterium]